MLYNYNMPPKTTAQQKQDEIYQKMPAQKKLEIVGDFYKTGKLLEKLNDKRKTSIPNPRLHRQSFR